MLLEFSKEKPLFPPHLLFYRLFNFFIPSKFVKLFNINKFVIICLIPIIDCWICES